MLAGPCASSTILRELYWVVDCRYVFRTCTFLACRNYAGKVYVHEGVRKKIVLDSSPDNSLGK